MSTREPTEVALLLTNDRVAGRCRVALGKQESPAALAEPVLVEKQFGD